MSRQNFAYALAWNDMDCDSLWFYWQRWDWLRLAGCEGTFTFSKPPQSIAKRHEFWGYVELEWWSHWGIFWIFLAAVGPVQLVTLVFLLEAQECSSRDLLTYCSSAEFGSSMFPWQCVTGTGFVSPHDLPPSDEEDDEEGQLGQLVSVWSPISADSHWFPDLDSDVACLGVLFGWLSCDALAGTTHNLIPACRLWQGDMDKSSADIHLKHMVHVKRTGHVTDMWRTCQKPRLLRSVIVQREKAVQFLCVCRFKVWRPFLETVRHRGDVVAVWKFRKVIPRKQSAQAREVFSVLGEWILPQISYDQNK